MNERLKQIIRSLEDYERHFESSNHALGIYCQTCRGFQRAVRELREMAI